METNVLLRVQEILTHSINGLSDEDRAERIAWCQENDEHGTRAVPQGHCTEFFWGGRLLAAVPHDVLTAEPGTPIDVTFVESDD